MKTGDLVTITSGALLGSWGILAEKLEAETEFWWVRINGSHNPLHRRLLAVGQFEKKESK